MLRDKLVDIALQWQACFGVAPSITSSISEYDAAMKKFYGVRRNYIAGLRKIDFLRVVDSQANFILCACGGVYSVCGGHCGGSGITAVPFCGAYRDYRSRSICAFVRLLDIELPFYSLLFLRKVHQDNIGYNNTTDGLSIPRPKDRGVPLFSAV